nr:rna polymerase ii c-terminal domain phosphatase-like 4 [Quercus suber]
MKRRLRSSSKADEGLVACLSATFCGENFKRRKLGHPNHIEQAFLDDDDVVDEVALLRDWKTNDLLRKKKLILVLDLDQTLLEARAIKKLTSEENYLLESEAEADQDCTSSSGGKGSLFKNMWPKHQANLINIQKYEYFASSYWRARDDRYKSLAEKKIDESETNGPLARILDVLQRIHKLFFHPKLEVDLARRDARLALKLIRLKVLGGCVLFFSELISGPPEESHIWGMAEELGAMCTVELGPAVTHVVTVDIETEGAQWAEQKKKFLVHPTWIQAAYNSFQREPEGNFPVDTF